MLSDNDLTQFAYLISARFEAVNSLYIKRMSEQIKEIGMLGPANLHRLEQMMKMQMNIAEVNKELMKATKLSLPELYQVYDISGLSVYGDASKYYKANGVNQVPFKDNVWIQNYIEATKMRTAGTFMNISNTTSIQQDYINLVDTAISAVNTGVTDYNSAIRAQLTDVSMNGIRVQYASGLTRRLDSAIRMNILEGVREINNNVREQTGKEFGADGVEISVHALCAKDHIEYQGKQYSKTDFANLQAGLRRKISTCNCKHITYPIILGISEPAYSQQELDQYKANSEQPVTITIGYSKGKDEEGNDILIPKTKTCTKYEATQYQRKIETEIRKAKDLHIAANNAGDTVLLEQSKKRIKSLRETYKRISNEAGLSPKWDRCYVPGYKGKQVVPKSIKINTIKAPASNNTVDVLKEIEKLPQHKWGGNDVINPIPLGNEDFIKEVSLKSHSTSKSMEDGIVEVNELITRQDWVHKDDLINLEKSFGEDEIIGNLDDGIKVVKYKNKYIVFDGNHRTALAKIRKQKSLKVKLLDLDE